jgi:hypothetical protein
VSFKLMEGGALCRPQQVLTSGREVLNSIGVPLKILLFCEGHVFQAANA